MFIQLNLEQTILRTSLYTPVQTSNIQPSTFTINTINKNPQTHPTTSRTLSRSPLPHIQNNPLSNNLSSTNIYNIQHPSAVSHKQCNTLQIK